MIDFVRRSGRWLATAEYTYVIGVVWLGGFPIPVFRVTMNDALQTLVMLMLWLAVATLTLAQIAGGPLPGPQFVAHWLTAQV